jgi:2-polyprenyl-3-methyl-5-hydroxy-6-metoxy-1,4-benzoquinol methylase
VGLLFTRAIDKIVGTEQCSVPTIKADMDKKAYFDRYWEEMNIQAADLRTIERVEIVSKLLTNKKGKLLDVGCGRGISSEMFKKMGFEVEGFDISPEIVEMAKKRGINAHLFDIESDTLKGKYDVIICLEVLQFLVDPLKALKNLSSALVGDGEIILSLPNEFHLWRRVKIFFGHYDFAKYDAPHLRLFHFKGIKRLVEEARLEIVKKYVISIVPPRSTALRYLGKFLTKLSASLFAISFILKVKPKR